MNTCGFIRSPSLYIQNEGEVSTKIALRLTCAQTKCVVRITGGCGLMTQQDADGLYDLFARAFWGFSGAMLFGGTRMIDKVDASMVIPGITEIPPLIKRKNKEMMILGVVPKTRDLDFSPQYGLVVSAENEHSFSTVVHPEQDMCLMVQGSVDRCVCWDTEYIECLNIIENLRAFAQWQSVLVSYNGGGTTEREIMATAKRGWPVILVAGSGRVTEKLAQDEQFLRMHPHVMVVQKEVFSMRSALMNLGVIPREHLKIVEKRKVV